jgi:hypothetical protein
MTTTTDRPSAKAPRNPSNRTVAIIVGSVILVLTVIFASVGGGWVALAVPLGFLACAVAIILFRIAYERVILPLLALFVMGGYRLVKLARGKRDNCQPSAPPNGGPATTPGNSDVDEGPPSVS